jgi:UDP-glucose 4-epimerase
MKRIAITGSSGYYGRKLIQQLRIDHPEARILGCDVTPPREGPPDEFASLDVRNPQLADKLREFQPDTIVHLAFVVNPIHNDALMRDVNVNGTRNVMDAVRSIHPARFLIASSATAYGAWPDNPVPMPEEWQLRARPNFRYAVDKHELEQMFARFAAELPEIAVSWVRPAIIYGPGVNNYLSKFLFGLPLIVLPDGRDLQMQFVHEDDVAAATCHILRHNARGPFNIGPPDWVTMSDIARETRRFTMKLPFWAIVPVTTMWWGLRLPIFEFPPGLLWFVRYPWVVEPRRLQQELGFQFRYSSLDTLRESVKARSGK